MEYWINRLDNVRMVLVVLLLGCIYIEGNALMAFVKSSLKSDEVNYNRIFSYALVIVCVLVLLLVFMPSARDSSDVPSAKDSVRGDVRC